MKIAELLAKIKAEIERLKDENNNIRCDSNKAYCQGYGDAFVDLFPFLDTLEEPASDDLEEAAVDIADALIAKPKDYILSAKADYWNGAHDGIIAGAKWMEAHTPIPEDTVLFNKGVEEGKRLMMEEAVEGEVTTDNRGNNVVRAGVFNKDFEYGDKVRVIIVKEDEK